jgi:hypothetical protein
VTPPMTATQTRPTRCKKPWTTIRQADDTAVPSELHVLMDYAAAGVCILERPRHHVPSQLPQASEGAARGLGSPLR